MVVSINVVLVHTNRVRLSIRVCDGLLYFHCGIVKYVYYKYCCL